MDDQFTNSIDKLNSSLNCVESYKTVAALIKKHGLPKASTGDIYNLVKRDCNSEKDVEIQEECLNALEATCQSKHRDTVMQTIACIASIFESNPSTNTKQRLLKMLLWTSSNTVMDASEKITFAQSILNIYFISGAMTETVFCEMLLNIVKHMFDFDIAHTSLQYNLFLIQLIIGLTYHKTNKIRKASCEFLQKQFNSCRSCTELYPNYYTLLIPSAVQTFEMYMKLFCDKDTKIFEVLTSQCQLFLSFYGINMKKKTKLLNSALKLLEIGFSRTNENIRIASFKLWCSVISSFAEDLNLLSSERYLKLLMQPLISANALYQSENVSVEKIKTFWFLVQCLNTKIFQLFNSVCLPLLYICLGAFSKSSGSTLNSSLNRRSSLNESKFAAQLVNFGFNSGKIVASKHFSSQLLGIEILVHLLNAPNEISLQCMSLSELRISVTSEATFFPRYVILFIETCNEVYKFIGHRAPLDLLMKIWQGLNRNVRKILEELQEKKKTDAITFNAYFSLVKNTISEQRVPQELCMDMLNDCSDFPASILSSTFYGNSSGTMASTPASALLKISLSKTVILSEADNTKVITSSKQLIQYSMKDHQIFCLLTSLTDIFNTYYGEKDLKPSQVNILLAIWDKVAIQTSQMIRTNQEINEGDAADHDFSTIYGILFIPFNILRMKKANSSTFDISNWKVLYNSFLWASNFVTTCKPNEIELEILQRFHDNIDDLETENSAANFMLSAIEAVIDCMNPLTDELETDQNISDILNTFLERILDFGHDKHIEKFLNAAVNLFKRKLKNKAVGCAFGYFVSSLTDVIDCYVAEGVALKDECKLTITSIVKSVTTSLRQNAYDISDKLISSIYWDDFLQCGLESLDSEIKSAVAELYHEAIVKQETHSSICQKYNEDIKNLLLPFYKDLHWTCPWDDSQDENSDADGSLQEISANKLSPPHAAYGAFGSPAKKTLLSPFKKSPNKKLKTPEKESKKNSQSFNKTRSSKSLESEEANNKLKERKTSSRKTGKNKRSRSAESEKVNEKKKDCSFNKISKELNVTPLDDSFDVSEASETDNSKEQSDIIVDTSCRNSDDSSYIVVVDMSCANASYQEDIDESKTNTTDNFDNTSCSSKDTTSENDKSIGSDGSFDKSTDDCYVKMVDTSSYKTPSTSLNESKEDEVSVEVTLDEPKDCSHNAESGDMEEIKTTNDDMIKVDETGGEESYVEMVDMSCNDTVNINEMETTSENNDDILNATHDNADATTDADDSEYVVMVDQSLNASYTNNNTREENKINDSQVTSDVDNSLISEDQSDLIEDEEVYSIAHSTCTFESSPKMVELTSPIAKESKQSSPSVGSLVSPSSKSILKRGSTFVPVEVEPSPKRRVSFAYPIAISKAVNEVDVPNSTSPTSPVSPRSPKGRRLSSPHSAHRRLHLPSPLSLRSSKVAAEIGKIRAKNGQENDRLDKLVEEDTSSSKANEVTNIDDIDFEAMTNQQLAALNQRVAAEINARLITK